MPGEDRRKGRPLKAAGAKYATKDKSTAIEVAQQMWAAALFQAERSSGVVRNIADLTTDYMVYAREYYRASREAQSIQYAITVLADMYPQMAPEDFGAPQLKAVQTHLVKKGLARTTVNRYVSAIRRMFKWAVVEGHVPASVAYGLACLPNLKRGRSKAPEPRQVVPVEQADFEAILPHMPPVVRDMAQVQALTGMRSTEVCNMRPADVDRSEDVWVYRPKQHKEAFRGHVREVALGPRCQAILTKYMDRGDNESLFSPTENMAAVFAERHANRKTPLSCGNKPGSHLKDDPKTQPGDRYDKDTYGRAVARACNAARRAAKTKDEPIPQRFTPHQLRHSFGTLVRDRFGLDEAAAVLGHADVSMTQHYAKLRREKAVEVAKQIG